MADPKNREAPASRDSAGRGAITIGDGIFYSTCVVVGAALLLRYFGWIDRM